LVTVERINALRPGALYSCALLVVGALLFGISGALAQPTGPVISAIRIAGNQRVEQGAIRIHITSRVGAPMDRTTVDEDIKAIYAMGFFDEVAASTERENGRMILVYRVKERPLITGVKIEGMKEIKSTADAVIDAIKVHAGSILDPTRVEATIKALKKVYEDKGYLDAEITFSRTPGPRNTAVALFHVKEGPLVRISRIEFSGNKSFSARSLEGVMATRAHSILSFLTGAGILDRKKLQDDVDRITAFYYDHGHLNVHVGDPVITRRGDWLTIHIYIVEGPTFRVGTVGVTGTLKFPKKELTGILTLKPKDVFSGSTMEHDVLTLSDFYSNRGYAFVNVDPRTQIDQAAKLVNVTYAINPGHEVLVDRINITGNTKTSDKVIRRELTIQEQEPYSAYKIAESKQRLDQLGFFQNVQMGTSPAPQPNKIDLHINVQEGNTASLQVGGGYDSASSVFGNFSIGNTNLFGGGESARATAAIGFLFQEYSVSYTEPWFLDMPLSVTLQAFDNKLYLFSFNQSSIGFGINTFYPLTELGFKKIGPLPLRNVSLGLGYKFESVGISGMQQPFTTFDLLRAKGYTRVSEVMPSIRRFTVDNPLDPRSGSIQRLDLEIAGLGGSEFIKGVFHTRFFFPYIKSPRWGEWVYSPSVTFGIGTNLGAGTGGELPLYERFFPGGLGGSGDVRGYALYSLGPQVTLFNQLGQPFTVEQIGGSKELLLSNETTFPIWEAMGLRGVIFLDAGQAYRLRDSIAFDKLQAAYGIGIRWHSPFGPISIDVARPINPRPNDQKTIFDLGAGAPL
jgi:outer membrane protein insertion porin family